MTSPTPESKSLPLICSCPAPQHDTNTVTPRLINILKTAGQPVPDDLLKFGTTVKKKVHPVYGAFYREVKTTDIPAKIVFDN